MRKTLCIAFIGILCCMSFICLAEKTEPAKPDPAQAAPAVVKPATEPANAQPAAVEAWKKFQAKFGESWKIRWNPTTGLPTSLSGGKIEAKTGEPTAIARNFLPEVLGIFGIKSADDLKVARASNVMNADHVRFQQLYKGLEVVNGHLYIHMQSGSINLIDGMIFQVGEVEVDSKKAKLVDESAIKEVILKDLNSDKEKVKFEELVKAIYPNNNTYVVVYRALVIDAANGGFWTYIINAQTKDVIIKQPGKLDQGPY